MGVGGCPLTNKAQTVILLPFLAYLPTTPSSLSLSTSLYCCLLHLSYALCVAAIKKWPQLYWVECSKCTLNYVLVLITSYKYGSPFLPVKMMKTSSSLDDKNIPMASQKYEIKSHNCEIKSVYVHGTVFKGLFIPSLAGVTVQPICNLISYRVTIAGDLCKC